MPHNKAIYTAIFNNYDLLKPPKFVNDGYDYVLFTDEYTIKEQQISKKGRFKVIVIEGIQNVKDAFMKSKDIKINPEKYLPEYQSSIYIDGSFEQIGDVNEFLRDSKNTYQMCCHPRRDCAYDEAEVCMRQRLGNSTKIPSQMSEYQAEGFPINFGLCMGGIIARTHNKKAKRINLAWWNEVSRKSTRDQLSINYVLWKLNEKIGLSDYENRISSIFRNHKHNTIQ